MTAAALSSPQPVRGRSATTTGLLWGATAICIWALYLAFARSNVVAGASPADLTFMRYATAGVVMLPFLLRRGIANAGGIGWRRAFVLSVFAGPLFLLASASGFLHAPLAHGAVLQPATLAVGGLVLGAIVLGESLSPPRLIGAAIIVSGLVLTAGPDALRAGAGSLAGDALFAAAGAMWALFAVLSRRWQVDPMAATAAVTVISAAIYAPIYLLTTGIAPLLAQPLPLLVEQIVVQGLLAGILAVFAFGRAVELLGAGRAAALPAMVPVVATLIGIPVAGELPGPAQAAGLAIVTLGLFITQRAPSATET